MANYTSERHRFARGPITDNIRVRLVNMIKRSKGKEELLAEDIIEAMAVARNDNDGFKAAERLIKTLESDYQ